MNLKLLQNLQPQPHLIFEQSQEYSLESKLFVAWENMSFDYWEYQLCMNNSVYRMLVMS